MRSVGGARRTCPGAKVVSQSFCRIGVVSGGACECIIPSLNVIYAFPGDGDD